MSDRPAERRSAAPDAGECAPFAPEQFAFYGVGGIAAQLTTTIARRAPSLDLSREEFPPVPVS